ncbi:hypothetical protein [Vibrio owensii]|uniref:hypothetical protein n=1 Tax=Vibrio owensii TaxID=696485 RepID=UPI0018F1E2D1|nr:hypothetical protein [Vibrio owensii]
MRGINVDSLHALDELLQPNENAVYLLDENDEPVAVVTSHKYFFQTKAEIRILEHLLNPESKDALVDELFDKHSDYELVVSALSKQLIEKDQQEHQMND